MKRRLIGFNEGIGGYVSKIWADIDSERNEQGDNFDYKTIVFRVRETANYAWHPTRSEVTYNGERYIVLEVEGNAEGKKLTITAETLPSTKRIIK